MPRCSDYEPEESWDDESTAGEDDPEGPSDEDLADEDDDETPTVPCPNCSREIPDFVDRCPYCHQFVTQGGGTGRTLLYVIIAVLVIIGLLYAWM